MRCAVRDSKLSDYTFLNELFLKANRAHVKMQPDLYREVKTVIPKILFSNGVILRPALQALGREDITIKVAQSDDGPVGAIIVEQDSKYGAYLENLAVTPQAGYEAVAKALLEDGISWARAKNKTRVTAKISAANKKSLAKAHEYGFQIETVNMGLCLPVNPRTIDADGLFLERGIASKPSPIGNSFLRIDKRSERSWLKHPVDAVLCVNKWAELRPREAEAAKDIASRQRCRHISVPLPINDDERPEVLENAGFEVESYIVGMAI